MSKKLYEMPEETPMTVSEPALVYSAKPSVSGKWNPNVPFHATQEEWLEHIRRIEEGEFMSIEEADKEFAIWKRKFLASRI